MGRDLLAGRTALVTGGSGGIGRSLALQLAAEGTAVALGFRTSRKSAEQLAAEVAEQGRPVVAIEADLSKPEAPVELAEGVEFALGPIDILVANAGVGPSRGARAAGDVGHLGTPAEVADLTVAVLRNGYITNQVFSIDGGVYPR